MAADSSSAAFPFSPARVGLLLEAARTSYGVHVNRWNIPSWLEREVLLRDTSCIYCGVDFLTPGNLRGDQPSWEHIVNDATIITVANIARCCRSCNASKGARSLAAWLRSDYCRRNGITVSSIATVASEALIRKVE